MKIFTAEDTEDTEISDFSVSSVPSMAIYRGVNYAKRKLGTRSNQSL
jgi:hypothetical protein